jgi:3-hydroxyacyl-CoA dehydrogenase
MTAPDDVVRVTRDGDIAWVEIDNPPVNATSTGVRAGLMAAVDAVQGARVAMLICAGRTFVAGGDIAEFDAPPQAPDLPGVIDAMEHSATPFLAVLHGTVLGGGWEIAMGCAWRIARRGTQIGLPEVNIGLIPGAGGTQRAPRLVGMDMAIDMAAGGRMFDAEDVFDAGGVDQVFDGDLKAAALEFLASCPARPTAVSARECAAPDPDALAAKRAQLVKSARGADAPLLNVDALQWALSPYAQGQPRERALHMKLRQSPQSRALRHAFFAERQVVKPAAIKGIVPRDLTRIAVVGGGLMGSGIAMACLGAGLSVALIERDGDAAGAAVQRVHDLIEGAVRRGKITPDTARDHKARFASHAGYDAARGADLAIEAVFEDLPAKQAVFAALSRVTGPDTILATNTSYLDPVAVFDGIENPGRCLGLHFFSPAHVMKLLEVIATPDTAPDVLATGFALGKRLRKVPVLAGICDGFIGNRMLAEYRRMADFAIADGAWPQDVDAAARALGLPMGPFELQDLTGLQIGYANRKRLAPLRDPAQRYVAIADQVFEAGRIGQRSGRGWYDYADGSRVPTPSVEVAAMITAYSRAEGITRRPIPQAVLADRILAVLANEGARIVEDGIAENDAAIDMVQIHGYGFPRWSGGPMHMADRFGWDRIAAILRGLAAESPGSWRLSRRATEADQGRQA